MSNEKATQERTAAAQVPSHDSFTLILNRTIKGEPVIPNAQCDFSYQWDFQTNMGLACLDGMNGNKLNITLYPLGIGGQLAFMSDMEPVHVVINGQRVVLFRVGLQINLSSGSRSAFIMFNEDGSSIQVTPHFEEKELASFVPEKLP